MKKTIYLIAMLVLLVSCAQQTSTSYQKYNSAEFSIEYPQDWEISTMEGGIIAFSSPKESSNDNFVENLNVYVFELPQGVTLGDAVDEGVAQLQQIFSGFELIGVEETTHSGEPARKLSYKASLSGANLKFFQLATTKNNKVFTVTFTSEEQKHDEYKNVFEKMVNSFEPK